MFFTSDSLFETLCEFNETKIAEDCQHYEWVEWGVYDFDDDECYVEAEGSYFFGGEE